MPAKFTPAEKAERQKQILDGAIACAKRCGFQNVTRDAIAAAVGVSSGTINLHFSTMTQLKRDIMRAAIKAAKDATPGTEVDKGMLEIIAQGLASGDQHAKKAPPALKERALAALAA